MDRGSFRLSGFDGQYEVRAFPVQLRDNRRSGEKGLQGGDPDQKKPLSGR